MTMKTLYFAHAMLAMKYWKKNTRFHSKNLLCLLSLYKDFRCVSTFMTFAPFPSQNNESNQTKYQTTLLTRFHKILIPTYDHYHHTLHYSFYHFLLFYSHPPLSTIVQKCSYFSPLFTLPTLTMDSLQLKFFLFIK
jgi:hypothetical protein